MVEGVYICQQIVHSSYLGQTYTVILFEQRMGTTNSGLISLRKISVKFSLVSRQDGVHFREGVATLHDPKTWFTPTQRGLLVIDDLMRPCRNDELVVDIFTKHSHHSNITVCYFIQDLFPAGKYAKTMNRNTHYMAVFKNPRDKTGIRTVLLQAFSSLWQEALTLFQEATQQPFGYFWLDLHPALDDRYRFWTNNILDKDFAAIVYEQIHV